MKKSVLALAVAAALAAPIAAQADTILYGSARLEVDYIEEKSRVLMVIGMSLIPPRALAFRVPRTWAAV